MPNKVAPDIHMIIAKSVTKTVPCSTTNYGICYSQGQLRYYIIRWKEYVIISHIHALLLIKFYVKKNLLLHTFCFCVASVSKQCVLLLKVDYCTCSFLSNDVNTSAVVLAFVLYVLYLYFPAHNQIKGTVIVMLAVADIVGNALIEK